MRAIPVLAFAAFVAAAHPALAGTWPDKPIRVIVPFGAGSVIDIVPRVIFARVAEQMHQSIVIEDRPGAGGIIGAAAVAKSPPDGYTFLVNSNAQVTAPLLHADLSYDPVHDFTAVAPLFTYPDVLIISRSQHITSLDAFVRAAKARDGGMTFASLGIGTGTFMSAERFRLSAGYAATAIQFRGAAEAIREVLAGRVDYCFCSTGTTLALIRQGGLAPLAVSTPSRSPLLPDVPTTLEAGFADSDYRVWIGLFAPSRTPPEVIKKLNHEIAEAVRSQDVRDRFEQLGLDALVLSPDEFSRFVEHETNLNIALVQKLGLQPH